MYPIRHAKPREKVMRRKNRESLKRLLFICPVPSRKLPEFMKTGLSNKNTDANIINNEETTITRAGFSLRNATKGKADSMAALKMIPRV